MPDRGNRYYEAQKVLHGEILPPRRYVETAAERIQLILIELHNYQPKEEKQVTYIIQQPEAERENAAELVGELFGRGLLLFGAAVRGAARSLPFR